MIFVFGLDQSFVMPTGVAIRSLDRFLSPADQIALLSTGLTDSDRHQLNECARTAKVTHHDCEGLSDPSWIPVPYLSPASYLRYLAPSLLPNADRCVYLDGDVVVRRDVRPLHDVDLNGATLAAVRSRVAPFAASPGGIRRWMELGIPSTAPYFNSGVYVMDLDRWRRRDVTARIADFLRRHGADAYLADQEALNVAVTGDWVQLDRTWNYITHVAENFLQQPELEPTDPHIVHFAGRLKPWSWGRQPLFAEDWHASLAETPWAGFAPSPPSAPKGLKAAARRTIGRMARGLRDLAQA